MNILPLEVTMNKYELFKKELIHPDAMHEYINSKVERIFSNDKIDIAKYHLTKDSILYIEPIDCVGCIKTYTVIEGCVVDLESKEEWHVGDFILIDHFDDYLSIMATEPAVLLVHVEQSTSITHYEESSEKMIRLLANLQLKDHYTKEHSDRVFGLVKYMGLELGYHSKALYNLNKAARFHDIGKVFIDDAILNKPGKLDEEEYKRIQQHTVLGKDLILEVYNQDIYDIVAQHHERWDGSGYPLGLKGEEISIGARILAICDSFDAMTSNRVYSNAKMVYKALEEIESLSGILYDPELVKIFVRMINKL